MNVLVDTNVWLDVLQDRAPHYELSAKTISVLERPEHETYLGATTLTTIFYLQQRTSDTETAHRQLRRLLKRYRVAQVDGRILRAALDLQLDDFADAVLQEAAIYEGLDAIVTRNTEDFDGDSLRIYTPEEFLAATTGT